MLSEPCNNSRVLVENHSEILQIDTNHCTNHVRDEADSLCPVKLYRECFRFYDWLITVDSGLFFYCPPVNMIGLKQLATFLKLAKHHLQYHDCKNL